MQRLLKLAPFLLFLIPGLIVFILNAHISWGEDHLFWMMAFVFHIPLLLFLIAAVMVEIITIVEKKNMG